MFRLGRLRVYLLLPLVALSLRQCHTPDSLTINLQHVLSLVDSIRVDSGQLYYVAIYADYPTYKPSAAEGEGIGCVDDAGRLLEILQVEVLEHRRKELLPIVRGLTKFLLYMSRPDGLWYNFIFPDGRINTTHQNSRAEFGWWAVRGLRGLVAAQCILSEVEPESYLLPEINRRLEASLRQLENRWHEHLQLHAHHPGWLLNNASDLSSELLLALTNLQTVGDRDLLPLINSLAAGISDRQWTRTGHPLRGMYFCWEQSWHAWGSNQAYALMQVYRLTGDTKLLESVRLWADNFVPFLLRHKLPGAIHLHKDGTYTLVPYPQIAYGVHAIYSGIISLAEETGSATYQHYADRVLDWLRGKNCARVPMYDSQTGRVFDGIDGAGKTNLNSGAESTIEGLGAIQKYLAFKGVD